ncbi:MAG TPA: BatD family protein [Chthoniobacterales bacterium]
MKTVLSGLWLALLIVAHAAGEPSLRAYLSDASTRVDVPVQLQIEVIDGTPAGPPGFTVEGLAINFAQESRKLEALNLRATASVIFSYVVTPTRAGNFVIPAVAVTVDGRSYQTPALHLNVAQNSAGPSGTPASDQPFFGELVVSKEVAYVGEQIPIELRFYFDRRIIYQPYPQGQLPIIEGDGFVTRKYPEPVERRQVVNGQEFKVVIYKTAISGVKAGRLELHSAYQEFLLRLPYVRHRSDAFDDFTGQLPFPDLFDSGPRKDVKVETNGVAVEVKALPESGRPTNFSGAVGQFEIRSEADPVQMQVGDPVTLRVEVRGSGNFDRMEAPQLVGAAGWHAYEPTDELATSDDVGISAVKTFNFPLVAEAQVTQSPGAALSYFDPEAERYVEVKAPAVPMNVAGPAVVRSTPSVAEANSPAPGPETPPSVDEGLRDLRLTPSPTVSFTSILDRPAFWYAQLFPAAVLAAFLVWQALNRLGQSYGPVLHYHQERRQRHRELASGDALTALAAACRLIELKPLIRSRGRAPYRQAEYLVDHGQAPENLRRELKALLRRQEALAFGRTRTDSPWPEEERRIVRDAITRWEALP